MILENDKCRSSNIGIIFINMMVQGRRKPKILNLEGWGVMQWGVSCFTVIFLRIVWFFNCVHALQIQVWILTDWSCGYPSAYISWGVPSCSFHPLLFVHIELAHTISQLQCDRQARTQVKIRQLFSVCLVLILALKSTFKSNEINQIKSAKAPCTSTEKCGKECKPIPGV